MVNKKMVIAAAALAVMGGTVFTVRQVSAQETTSSGPFTTVVDKLVNRFGLNRDEVVKLFDEAHAEHRHMMESNLNDRLDQAVANGKLTEAQKQLIITKRQELQAEHETHHAEMEGKTPEEFRTMMEAKHAELERWAADNDIDLSYLMIKFGKGPGHGGKFMIKLKEQ